MVLKGGMSLANDSDAGKIEAYKQAIKINPDFANAYFGLGAVYVFSNDRASALEQYKILKNINSEFANELFNRIGE